MACSRQLPVLPEGRAELDQRLCFLAQHGSADAYAQLRQRHRGLVSALLQRQGRGRAGDEQEDLEQEVWLGVWRGLSRFQGRSTFATWLAGITKNVSRSQARRHHFEPVTLPLEELADAEPVQPTGDDPLKHVCVEEALSHLADPERRVIDMRYYQGLSDPEIAQRLDLPLGTVKGRLRSGLSHLRMELV
jgi:RNA polymerase sigma factor (sigma-70 family)